MNEKTAIKKVYKWMTMKKHCLYDNGQYVENFLKFFLMMS